MKSDQHNSKSFISVVIVDDDKSYRDCLKKILAQDDRIRIYSEYETGLDFIKSLHSPFQPDVCLMDIVLKDMSGIECSKEIKKKFPNVHVVLMTAFPESKTFIEAREIGADYLEKGPRVEAFLDKIVTTLTVSKEEKFISFQLGDSLKLQYLELANELEKVKTRMASLSNKQLAALKLKKEGKSEKEIADILHINPGTAHTHLKRAFEKLKLPNLLDYLID